MKALSDAEADALRAFVSESLRDTNSKSFTSQAFAGVRVALEIALHYQREHSRERLKALGVELSPATSKVEKGKSRAVVLPLFKKPQ